MLLEQVLKAKGHSVVCVQHDETLAAVAATLDRERIGAVVALSESGDVVGVLSERDIVRQIARNGPSGLDMRVDEAMTRDVVFAAPSEGLDVCLERMTDRRVRHLPVLQDGRLAGLVSIGDLVKWKIAAAEAEADSLKAYLASG